MKEFINKILSKSKIFNTNIEYIDFIKSIENDNIVLERYFANIDGARFDVTTSMYNYRIYVDYIDCGKYLLEIRKNLSRIYKSYGIYWEIYYSVGNNHIITIEEREKLEVCSEQNITCDELLLNWKKTLDKLSEELKFSEILKQIREKITSYKKIEVYKLVMIKDGVINASDFAITSNKNIILIEDYDFSFYLTNFRGEPISFYGLFLDVNTTCGIMTFSLKYGAVFYKNYNHLYDYQEKFFLYDNSYREEYLKDNVFYYDDSINSQIKIFINDEQGKAKFENEYIAKYLDKYKLDGKNILLGEKKAMLFERKDGKRIS